MGILKFAREVVVYGGLIGLPLAAGTGGVYASKWIAANSELLKEFVETNVDLLIEHIENMLK